MNDLELKKYTYQDIASRLSWFNTGGHPLKIILCSTCEHPARDRINLDILKQFGIVPDELFFSGPNPGQLLHLFDFSDLILMIDSIPVGDSFLEFAIPSKYQHIINTRSKGLCSILRDRNYVSNNGYIYLAGFSKPLLFPKSGQFDEFEYIPWYLEVDNKYASRYVVRQPELNHVLEQLELQHPKIPSLEDYIAEMVKLETKRDDI